MNNQNNKITLERYQQRKNIIKDAAFALSFFVLLLIIALVEKNLILPGSGLGFLEHKNTYLFLFISLMTPIIIHILLGALECSIDQDILEELKIVFKNVSELQSTAVLWNLFRIIGFCFFIVNSLQNAQVLNQLPFDYWDSINHPGSYIVSRFYKLYLFPIFLPNILIYVFILIKSLSKLLIISDTELAQYPLKRHSQFNSLCNFGLNIILTILMPFTISSIVVYSVHNRFDITTITTVIVSGISALISLGMYTLLIKNFRVSIKKYRKKNIERINENLAEIHQYILQIQYEENDKGKLDVAIKKEEYLCQIKEKIEKQSKFPYIIKSVFTIFSPIIPSLLKIMLHL